MGQSNRKGSQMDSDRQEREPENEASLEENRDRCKQAQMTVTNLKTGVRKDLGVRIPRPPLHLRRRIHLCGANPKFSRTRARAIRAITSSKP
jgi:hypothetical protein